MGVNTFTDLDLSEQRLGAIETLGWTVPTPIQAEAIPPGLAGTDVVGIAQTGTGKTAAFALPLLQRLHEENAPARPRCPRALILAPTRELALQIHEEMAAFGRYTRLRHTFIFGGVGQNPQVRSLARGVDVLVATPGRLLDLAGQGHVDLSEVSVLVLDEADRLLDMGFIRDVKRIVAQTPATRQSLLFSATMPKEVAALARDILKDPVRVDVAPKQVTLKEIDQRVVMVDNGNKRRTLEYLLRDEAVSRAIVFTRTKHGADKVARQLKASGIGVEVIHGNKSQSARQRALQNFKDGDAWVLVATDIAARGIDIDAVSDVFNYELPHEAECYVHRIGRTARAGATGVAWSLVDPSERPRLRAVERLIRFSPAEVEVELEPQEWADSVAQRKKNQQQSAGRDRPAKVHVSGASKQRSKASSNSKGDQSSAGRRRTRRKSRRRAA